MNLTPTQKADELIEKFKWYARPNHNDYTAKFGAILTTNATKCAIIAVDEMLSFFTTPLNWDYRTNGHIHFWQEVKTILTDRL